MNFTLSIITLAAVMAFCGLFEKPISDTTPANAQRPQNKTSNPGAKQAAELESLKQELVRIENEMTEGAMNGDNTQLAQHTAEEFVFYAVDGRVLNKADALADVKRDKNILSWLIIETELLSSGENAAVLKYVLSMILRSGDKQNVRVTDTFVKHDGRWLLKSSEHTIAK